MQFAHNGSYKGSIPFGLIYFNISYDSPDSLIPGTIFPSFPASPLILDGRGRGEVRTRGEEEGS